MKIEFTAKELRTIKYALCQLDYYQDELFVEDPVYCLELENKVCQAMIQQRGGEWDDTSNIEEVEEDTEVLSVLSCVGYEET